MKKNLKTIVMLSLALISIFAVTFAFSGAWFTDSDSKTATITVGKKVEITVDATVPEDTTIMPGSKFEITDIVGVASTEVSNMYVRASVQVANTYANVLTPSTTSTGWVELDGYFYYSSADSLTADSTLRNLTELVAGNSTGSLNLTLNVSEEATQEPTDETYLAPGTKVTVTITFEAIQSANTEDLAIKDAWKQPPVTLIVDGTQTSMEVDSISTLQDVINAYNATATTALSDSTTCGWFADEALTQAITPTAVNDYSNIFISSYSGFYTKTVDAAMLANMTFTLNTETYEYSVKGNNDSVTEIIIPSAYSEDGVNVYKVTSLEQSAFSDYASLKSVTLSNSITELGKYTFDSCSELASLIIPSSITVISESFCDTCESLSYVIITNNLTKVGTYAFSDTALTDVFYMGTEADKANITINSGNSEFKNATWHYAGEWQLVDGVPTLI